MCIYIFTFFKIIYNIDDDVIVVFALLLFFFFLCAELEKQMKIENLFVTWQQRSAQSNMPIAVRSSLRRLRA